MRKGVMWHNGEELTADHIAWNITRWTRPGDGLFERRPLRISSAMVEDSGKKDAKGKPIMSR